MAPARFVSGIPWRELARAHADDLDALLDHALSQRNDSKAVYGGTTLPEDYVRRERCLHVHFGWRRSAESDLSNFCAVYERLPLPKTSDLVDMEVALRPPLLPRDQQAHSAMHGHDELDETVLIGIVEFVKQPERGVATPVPSVIRLNPLDDCHLIIAEGAPGARPTPASVAPRSATARSVDIDREARAGEQIVVGWMGLFNELIGELVERRAEIVCDLADGKRPTDGDGCIRSDMRPESVLARLRVTLSNAPMVAVIVDEAADCAIELLGLSGCAACLCNWAIQRKG